MLAYQHRISDDIDVFIPDPNVMGLLSPVLNERIADEVSKYVVDHGAIKLYFTGLGEIDFIFCSPLVGGPTGTSAHAPELPLEPVTEVFAKKLYHRGDRITPRDVFDWWYIGTHAPEALDQRALAHVLHDKLAGIDQELHRLQTVIRDPDALLSPAAAWANIRSPYLPDQAEALAWAVDYVDQLRACTSQPPPP